MSEKNLIETQLQQAKTSNTPRSLLINGKLRLTGIVKAFDGYMVVLSCHNTIQLVYRHSITDISEVRRYARPETAAGRKPAQVQEKGRERKPSQAAPAPRRETGKPTVQPQTPSGSMPGALGEELRKWLQRTDK